MNQRIFPFYEFSKTRSECAIVLYMQGIAIPFNFINISLTIKSSHYLETSLNIVTFAY